IAKRTWPCAGAGRSVVHPASACHCQRPTHPTPYGAWTSSATRWPGRRLKCLTVADDFTHESVDITVDHGISGAYVVRVLDQAAQFRGYPRAVRTDNGPEFTSRIFIAWAQQHGIDHLLIDPGRPMQNGYIESFNGKFRDECLNEHWFTSLAQARDVIGEWRRDYNEVRPHSS